MRARTSFTSREIANGTSRAKRKYRDRLLDDGDSPRTHADRGGRILDRGTEALSPDAYYMRATWSEMARETRPGASRARPGPSDSPQAKSSGSGSTPTRRSLGSCAGGHSGRSCPVETGLPLDFSPAPSPGTKSSAPSSSKWPARIARLWRCLAGLVAGG